MLPSFPMVVRTLAVGPGFFLCFLPDLPPPSGSGSTGSLDFSSPLGFPTFAMGSPRQGRGLSVLDRNEGLVSPLRWGTLVRFWLALPPLSAGLCAPGPQGVLPGGPRCVLTRRFTLTLSRVLHGPWSGFSVASPTLARGLGLSFIPYPLFCRLGLVPRSVAQLCALQLLVPSFRVYLSEAVGFGGFLGSLLCAPLAVGLLPGSPNRLCPLSADCLLGLEPFPSGVASASDCRFSWHPGAAGALAVPSLRLRVSESSSLSAWSFPFRSLSLFLAFVPLLEALSESLTHSFSRSFLVVALYASAVGFADALWLCPERALRHLFASVSLLALGALSPLLHRVFPDGFRHRCTFRFCGGASTLELGPVGTLGGVAVAPPISPYTGPGWSPPFCRVLLVLRSVFSVYCAAFRPSSWRSFGQFH